ncbi:DNA-binding transcriptional LysR family regulator [Bradyrhizobium ottawaense]
MAKLPDFEALAIFAKVVELRSFAGAASELVMSKATVSKAVTRLEERLGARLFNRTSRRLALTDAGHKLAERATRLLTDGEAAENEALAQSVAPRGLVRLAVPMTFGIKAVAPLLPEFFEAYPEVSVDLHLSDATVDLIGEGFDMAVRIARLPDSSLIARRLFTMPRFTVAAPSYLKKHGRPTHPMHLAEHKCFSYAYMSTPNIWHYTNSAGEQASVRPGGQLRVNNGEAVMPALIAGLGIAELPEFIVGEAISSGAVEVILKDWKQAEGAVHLVTPARRPASRPRRSPRRFPRGQVAGHLQAADAREGQGVVGKRAASMTVFAYATFTPSIATIRRLGFSVSSSCDFNS